MTVMSYFFTLVLLDQGISLPKEWEAMPKDAYGKETAYHVVTLKAASPEYNDVHRKVMQSSQGQIARVATIRRIQNPQLYKSFMARKETMDKTGVNGSNERELFHGTSEASCDNINHHGFNRSMAGKNGNYGCYYTFLRFHELCLTERDTTYSMLHSVLLKLSSNSQIRRLMLDGANAQHLSHINICYH